MTGALTLYSFYRILSKDYSLVSLLFLTVQSLFIIRLCTNEIAHKFTLLKQHIKMIVLF